MSDQNHASLKIHNHLSFPLYVCSKEIIKIYTLYLEKIGLTYTQFITMMVLWERKTLTVKELGQYLFLDSGTLTPLLKKLEEKGLVSRCRSREDERNLFVSLTESGEALKETALAIPQMVKDRIRLSKEDEEDLHRILHQALCTLSDNQA